MKREENLIEEPKSFSKLVVAMILLLNVLFTVAILLIYLQVEDEPRALIVAWFAFTTGELWAMALIKKTETQKEADTELQALIEAKTSAKTIYDPELGQEVVEYSFPPVRVGYGDTEGD